MGRRASQTGALAAILAVGLGASAALGPWNDRPDPERWNVVLVSIDTLRADHLGCYGYEPPTSPMIDAFSREAILFEEAIAAAPSTLASHASMFTSLVVPHHGASIARRTRLPLEKQTLAEVLREHGYATASWNGGLQIHPRFGLDQGFDVYRSAIPRDRDAESFLAADHLENPVGAALDWIDGLNETRPFFLFLHSYEVHHPYTPKPELRALFGRHDAGLETDVFSVQDLLTLNREGPKPGDLDRVIASYDAEIRSADRAFGALVEGLRSRGLLERTVVVLISDHGEEFGEHGMVGWHSHTLYDELLHVPLLVRLPRHLHAARRVSGQVGVIDLAPTILDALGLRVPPAFQGRSLLGLMDEAPSTAGHLALSMQDSAEGQDTFSLRGGGWKWISNRGLFDLGADPGETNDLSRGSLAERARRRSWKRLARRWIDSRPAPADAVILDENSQERLRALGYIE